MKASNVATALLLVTALVTVTNLLHLPQHAAPGDAAADKDAALRAELKSLAAAAKSGEAFAREPPPAPPAPPAPIDKPAVPPSPPENKGSDFAGTTVAIVKPNLYDHGHTFGEFKIFAAIMWGARELGCKTVVVKNRAERPPHGRREVLRLLSEDQYQSLPFRLRMCAVGGVLDSKT